MLHKKKKLSLRTSKRNQNSLGKSNPLKMKTLCSDVRKRNLHIDRLIPTNPVLLDILCFKKIP